MTLKEKNLLNKQRKVEQRYFHQIIQRDNVIHNYREFYTWLNSQNWYKEHHKEVKGFLDGMVTIEHKEDYEI